MADSPLTGFVVVDLSTGIPGGYCTKLLSDGGAEVIKVEAPEGDPLRRWSASGAPIGPGEDGALFSFLAGGKHSVVADPAVADDVALVERSAGLGRRRGVVTRLTAGRRPDVGAGRGARRAPAPDRRRDHAVRLAGALE